jgi:hypothetical protein
MNSFASLTGALANISEQVHFQIIRVALGYSLLGVLIITAIVCVLSFITTEDRTSGKRRRLVRIEPRWLRNSLYTSLIVELATTGVLMFKQITTIDTKQVSSQVTTDLGKQAISSLEGDIKKIGIVHYWERSADFLPHIRRTLSEAKKEVLISGASFYLSIPDNEDIILSQAKKGVLIKYLILDPDAMNLAAIAKTFNQDEKDLRDECIKTVSGLRKIMAQLPEESRKNLQVRVFDESPRARFYIFDPHDPNSFTYFVPHVNAVNSPGLPGFQLQNSPFGLAQLYIPSVKEFWDRSVPLPDAPPAVSTQATPDGATDQDDVRQLSDF